MKKTKTYILYAKSVILYTCILIFVILMVVNSKASVTAVKNALVLCYNTIIPSLFPFFVLTGLLLNTGFVNVAGNILAPIMKPLFGVSGKGALAFVIGIISGYPMGAVVVSQLFQKGLISRKEAQKLLPFCNNSGPLFIVGAVGVGMFHSLEVGMFLYLVHVVSALLVGICFRFFGGVGEPVGRKQSMLKAITSEIRMYHLSEMRGFGQIFSECVQNAVKTTLNICGFVALFSSFLECIKPTIDAIFTNNMSNLMANGMLEITIGINRIANQNIPMWLRMILVSALIGWGGACVYLQVLGAISQVGLSGKTYLIGKLLQTVLSGIISYFALVVFGMKSVYTFSQHHTYITPTPLIQVVFLIFLIASLFVICRLCISQEFYKSH